MNNKTMSNLNIGNNSYEIKDAFARQKIEEMNNTTTEMEDKIDTLWEDYQSALIALNVRKDVLYNMLPTETASGSIASFPDGADDIPLKSLVVGIEPVQSGEGDPSPTNVRPISGWTGCNVSRVGKNLFGGLEFAQKIGEIANLPSYSIDTNNKTFTFMYAQPKDGSIVRTIFKLKTPARITAIVRYKNTGNNQSIIFRYTDGDFIKLPLNNTNGDKTTLVYTTSVNKLVDNVALSHYADASTTVYYDESGFFDGVVTASDFVPYAGNLYPITFPQEAGTVYGGTLDVVSGELVVDRRYIIFDGSEDEFWYTYSTTGYRVPKTDIGLSGNGICNLAPTVSSAASYGVMFNASANYIYFFQTVSEWGVATVADLRAWLATNNVEVCYERAEPITYHLTPMEVRTLLGQNNVWADTGDTSVTYRADIQRYIQKMLSQ